MSKYVNGSFDFKRSITKQWPQVEVSPVDLDINFDKIMELASTSDGYYTDMSDDRHAYVLFQTYEDANTFKERYLGVS